MATGQAIVEKALTHLKSTLTAEDNRAFSDTTLKDIWREARQVEKEQGARLDLRFMRRIEPFLQSLESYAGVLEVFCQGYSPMAFVWVCLNFPFLFFGEWTDTSPRAQSSSCYK